MSLSVAYTAVCDGCDEYAEKSYPSVQDAINYVLRGGWDHRDSGLFCEYCQQALAIDVEDDQ